MQKILVICDSRQEQKRRRERNKVDKRREHNDKLFNLRFKAKFVDNLFDNVKISH